MSEEVKAWSIDRVCEWLKAMNLTADYTEYFKKWEIKGYVLLCIQLDDLKEDFNVSDEGDCKTILAGIEKLRETAATQTTTTTTTTTTAGTVEEVKGMSADLLNAQDAATSNRVIEILESNKTFVDFATDCTAAILKRDQEDGDKLQQGIQLAIEKKVIESKVEVEECTSITTSGKTPDAIADEIIAKIGDDAKKGCVVTLEGLSGTGKGTTVKKLKEKLTGDGGKCQTWSNGNIFRSLTLLAATHVEKNGGELKDALTKENLAAWTKMLTFDKFDGQFDVQIDGLGIKALVSKVQNTTLKEEKVAKNIPTVAGVTQGEVINFIKVALKKMSDDGITVLVEGRQATLNYIRTPHRFELKLSDTQIIGKRRAAQRIAAEALKSFEGKVPESESEIGSAILKALGTVADDSYPPNGLEKHVKTEPEWIQLGCGNSEYICEEKGALFSGVNMPDALPDLTEHNNLMAQGMREHPEWYGQFKDKKTSLGVTLGQCIKCGIDQKGHPNVTICGLAAGDEESWTLFKPIFDYVLLKRHGHAADAKHTTDMNIENVSSTKIDPTGKYVLTSRCRTARSVRNFRLPPCNSFEERRKLESLITEGLLSLDGDLKGDYFPLPGSRSYAKKPGGMPKEYAEDLRNRGNLFQCPDSPLLLSSGCGRHWPDGRGIFHNDAKNFFVWIGEEDHMRIISMEEGDNIKNIFSRFCKATAAIQEVLKKNGHDFMHSEHLGFIAACPSNVGTGLRGGSMVKIPLFSARSDFKATCIKMGLQVRGSRGVDSGAGSGGVYDLSNAARIGQSETELLNLYIEGVANILRWEAMLEKKEDIEAEVAKVEPGKPVA